MRARKRADCIAFPVCEQARELLGCRALRPPPGPLEESRIMARTVKAYSISASDIATEHARIGDGGDEFDIAGVIQLDDLELREVGPHDVHLRIL